MLRFIDHIDAEEYWFTGSFIIPGVSTAARPLAVTGTFLQEEGFVVFEGAYRFAQGNISHPFTIRVTRHYLHAWAINVDSAATGPLEGHLHANSDGYGLLIAGGNASAVSAQIQLIAGHGLHVVGAIKLPNVALSFSASGSPGADREELGNVASIGQRRRV